MSVRKPPMELLEELDVLEANAVGHTGLQRWVAEREYRARCLLLSLLTIGALS